MKRNVKTFSIIAISILLIPFFFVVLKNNSLAAGIKTFPVAMDVEQTSARSMLSMVNDFRTGDDAWHYNESNQKVYVTDAEELTYDYNLEQIAIQRAYEVAISFSHTRPNGQRCSTCTYNGTKASGENIAIGYQSAESVFIGWREDNEDYEGQGHRINMLDSDYKAIGIGHVVYDGTDVWVQEFGWDVSGASYTEPINETGRIANIEINTDSATFYLLPEKSSLSGYFGDTGNMPAIKGYYKTISTWSYGSNGIAVPDNLLSNISWTSNNPNVISVTAGGEYEIVGTGAVTVTGSAVYDGVTYTCSVNFNAFAKNINNTDVSVSIPAVDFLPNGATSNPVITFAGKTLTVNTDYTLSFSGNTTATTSAVVTISGTGNFTGTRRETFEIKAVDITNCVFSGVADMVYTGKAITPSGITGTLNGQEIKLGTHFKVTAGANNINVGTATVEITGQKGLSGTKTLEYKITPKDVSTLVISEPSSKYYTGATITPAITVYNGYTKLVQDTDYTVSFANNVEIGTASFTVKGKGNFAGTVTKTFEITKVPVSALTKSGAYSAYYTGDELKPVPTFTYSGKTLQEGIDYKIEYSNNVNVGTGKYTITGLGVYEGTKEFSFSIYARSVVNCSITVPSATRYYTGTEICPEVTSVKDGSRTLVKDTDYEVTYTNNINARQYGKVTVKGIGNYNGSYSVSFYITPCPVSNLTIGAISSQTYTGDSLTPAVTLTNGDINLTQGTDFTVAYSQNINVGTATATITGAGNYSGTASASFKINAKSIAKATISAIASQNYTGANVTPALTVKDGSKTLVSGTDYTVAYSDNTKVGTATVTITGKGNYNKTKSTTFTIVAKPVSELSVGAIAAQVFSGSEITPLPVVKNGSTTLVKNTDYTLSYSNNINAGTATVVIAGKGNYSGTRSVTFTITAKSVSDLTVAKIAVQTYTGAALTPAVTVKDGSVTLVKGTDYTVTYSKNTDAGTATVTIGGKGNYTGNRNVTFTINPKSITKCTIGKIAEQTYTGFAILPEVTVKDGNKTLTKGGDYTVSAADNVSVSQGKATVTVTGKGNYTGSKSVTFTIKQAILSSLTMEEIPEQIYTGKEITPPVVFYYNGKKLTSGVDFIPDYHDNVKIGTATIYIAGAGNFTGEYEAHFTIKKERVYNVFDDVNKGAWYENAIQFVYDYDIMSGKSATIFGTSQPLKREQFTQVLYNHMGKPEISAENTFEDVKKEGYYYNSVLWAKENNITSGKTKTYFGVGQNITREELATMLYKYAKLRGFDLSKTEGESGGYSDSHAISSWAKESMDWAISQGIISGKADAGVTDKSKIRLEPRGNATRAECASMIKKLLEKNQ